MTTELTELSATFNAYITFENSPYGLEFETNLVESTVYLDVTDLPFRMNGRNTEIDKIHEGEYFTTVYVQTECYCDPSEVKYALLEGLLPSKSVSKREAIGENDKVKTDVKGDVIVKTGDEYDILNDNTVLVGWYEIKR